MGVFLICLTAIAWGTTGTTSALIAQQVTISPLIVGFWRIGFAVPMFWLWHGYNCRHQPGSSLAVVPRSAKDYRFRLILMGVCMAGYQVFYFAAVPYVGVAMTAMVAVCSSPLIITLLAVGFLGERLTRTLLVALGLGVTGTILLVAQPDAFQVNGVRFFVGVALAFGAAVSYASYAVFAKALVGKMDAIAVSTYSFTAAALVLTPTLGFHPNVTIWLQALPFLLYLGLITGGMAYGLYMLGIRHTSATVAGIAVLLEPLTAALLGIFIFKEPISGASLIGSLLLIISIIYAQRGDPSNQLEQ